MKTLKQHIKDRSKTHLIFDFDETIVRLLLPWEEWYLDVFDRIVQKDASLKGESYSEVQNKFVQKYGDKELNEIRSWNEDFETGKLRGIEENHMLTAFIKENPEYNYSIWSSNCEKTISKALSDLGLKSIFTRIACRSNLRFIKPHTEGFEIVKENGVLKEKYLFIGDSLIDEETSKKLGIDFYGIDHFRPIN